MNEYSVNLIRGETLPASRRRGLFALLLAYLACSGVLLVIAFSSASWQYARAAQDLSDIRALERDFHQDHRTPLTIEQYSRQLERDAGQTQMELDRIHQALAAQAVASRVVIGIASVLPAPAYLRSLTIDADKKSLQFEVAVPLRQAARPEFTAAHLITLWSRDPGLAQQVQRIEDTASERQNINMVPYQIWKFAAKLMTTET